MDNYILNILTFSLRALLFPLVLQSCPLEVIFSFYFKGPPVCVLPYKPRLSWLVQQEEIYINFLHRVVAMGNFSFKGLSTSFLSLTPSLSLGGEMANKIVPSGQCGLQEFARTKHFPFALSWRACAQGGGLVSLLVSPW